MRLCGCGHQFDESLGAYGCPNCEGDSSSLPCRSSAERQSRSRRSRESVGGKQIAVMLTPAAAAKLAAHVAQGETIAGVVNRLLSKSRPNSGATPCP